MEKMMQFDPQKRPTASQCLEHDYFKDFVSPVQNSIYGKSNKSFFNKTNEINSGMRKSSAVSKRLESRKSKLESRGINKNSFYKNRNKNPEKAAINSPANSYFNNPTKAGLPSLGKDSPGEYGGGGISKYVASGNKPILNSGDRNRSLPSGKDTDAKYGPVGTFDSGSILNKYSKNSQGMTGAQNYNPGGGLAKPGSDAYGLYSNPKGGLGGFSKPSRKDSAKDDNPSPYGGLNYGAGTGSGGISKYLNNKNNEGETHLPNVTNRQALGSGISIGGRRNVGAKLGSKEGSRGNAPSGGGLGGYPGSLTRKKESDSELPNLGKYKGAGGLGGLGGGLPKGAFGGGLTKGIGGGGLAKGGGLGRYNL